MEQESSNSKIIETVNSVAMRSMGNSPGGVAAALFDGARLDVQPALMLMRSTWLEMLNSSFPVILCLVICSPSSQVPLAEFRSSINQPLRSLVITTCSLETER